LLKIPRSSERAKAAVHYFEIGELVARHAVRCYFPRIQQRTPMKVAAAANTPRYQYVTST